MIDLLIQQLANGLALGMCYALVALGLTLVFGVLHVINFAHGEFYMLGGASVALLSSKAGVPYGYACVAAILIVCVVAWVVDLVAVKPVLEKKDGITTVLLTTFAISLLLEHGALGFIGPAPIRVDGLEGSLEVGKILMTWQRVLVIVVGIVLLCGIELILRKTLLGKRIRGVAQSAHAARVVGIRIDAIKTITFVGAAATAALAGSLLTPIVLFTPVMGQHIVISAFVIVVIGGMGNVSGAVICGLLLGAVESLSSVFLPQELAAAAIYALLLLTLLVRPQGLFAKGRR
ncbi:MAG: branched-chain amino acid ABC transporter permease [Polaromonas sp.]|uniref:branched-chain amino acid ABC transporter permease n=1 Tax=Polaromonas sp. TaxID=1869339 RepID=UPI0025D569A7|nr:branched-chain amino acid ABC transporter permease [Polaromonas sp.]MBI2726279.1 branched-chain amino acid ABC transporter permease [Polaromonas sp.]